MPVLLFPEELLSECFGIEVEIVTDTLEGKEPGGVALSDPLGSFMGRTRAAL
ncbi:MAG: hypothetical protein HY281_09115 [Nitrospirae bacterium]|nr:hypothetical protein [Nitrospirota bacterium]